MNSQFHTPSLGDEVFDLSGIESVSTNTNHLVGTLGGRNHQQEISGSKRMQNMEQSLSVSDVSDYNSYNGSGGGGGTNHSTVGIFNINPSRNHLNNQQNNKLVNATKPNVTTPTTTLAARKQLAPGINDPNELAKPLCPFSLFFRDTVSIIKQQNPNCNFQELSNIVSSMWEALDAVQQDVYKKKSEAARNEYIKQASIYEKQQKLQQQQQQQQQRQQQQQQPRQSGLRPGSDPGETLAKDCQQLSAAWREVSGNKHLQNPTQQPLQQQQPEQINDNSQNHQNQQQQQQQPHPTANIVNAAGATNTSPASASEGAAAPTQTIAANPTQGASQANTAMQRINHGQEAAPEQAQVQIAQAADSVQLCVREGCQRRAVMNPDWEDEYCSNECVVLHCRSVFTSWVQQNREAATSDGQ